MWSQTKLDISALFKVCQASLNATLESDVSYNCTTSEGSAGRGGLGPFGLLVLADASFSEQTPVYFYIAKNTDGTSRTYFCADESRSSTLSDVGKRVYGSTVPALHGEDYNMRLLVDHSIVESFAQGGRTVISSRVYPTKAIYKAAKVFLFNNATDISVKASLKIWKMGPAKFKHFPL
ncbi:putative beta-fructofuranosidase, Sucrose:sucrose fructosyltransferase [Helianthus anomalus]